ncbi:hypothetical protein ALC56_00017, partial [Trachymyrmex septentrionalis]
APKYLMEGENVSILPRELITKNTNENLERDRKLAFQNTKKFHDYNVERFNKNRKEIKLEAGDLVYVENGNRLNRKKLDEIRIGPYKIQKKISNSIYEIDTGHKKTESNFFHITKLIPVVDKAN